MHKHIYNVNIIHIIVFLENRQNRHGVKILSGGDAKRETSRSHDIILSRAYRGVQF